MSLNGAIQRLQAIALASTDVEIKTAPSYPVEDAGMLPMSIAHIGNGTGEQVEKSTMMQIVNVLVDVHFSNVNLKDAYTKINLIIPEFLKRVGGDPTLDGNTDSVVFPVSFEVLEMQWNLIKTIAVRFTVPLKFRVDPLVTST